MFKIFSHTALSFLLLVSTMGLVVSKHYCGGELVSVSLYHQADSCCDMDGCCQNDNHTFQVKDDFSSPAIAALPILAEIEILGNDLFQTTGLTVPETENSTPCLIDSSPPATIQKVLSLKQVYLL